MKDDIIQKTELFIKSLKRRTLITELDVYNYDDKDWIIYRSITGFLRGLYFHVRIFKQHELQSVIIEQTTDCEDEIKNILIKYKLL